MLVLLILGLAAFFFVFNPADSVLFPKCMFHVLTGYYCPGCGSQRAVHNLVHLNFAGVVSNNFLFLPAAVLIIYHYVYPLANRKFNWQLPNIFYLKSTPWIIFTVLILFWLLRNIPVYPFSVLAPGN